MQSINYIKTFYIVKALGKAEDAFKLNYNSKYFIKSSKLPRKRLRTVWQMTLLF